MFLEELASTHTNLPNLWFCCQEYLNPAKKTLDPSGPSVGFNNSLTNNSLIDCSIAFGFRWFFAGLFPRQVATENTWKMLQILNLGKKPRLILRSKRLQNFQNAKKKKHQTVTNQEKLVKCVVSDPAVVVPGGQKSASWIWIALQTLDDSYGQS